MNSMSIPLIVYVLCTDGRDHKCNARTGQQIATGTGKNGHGFGIAIPSDPKRGPLFPGYPIAVFLEKSLGKVVMRVFLFNPCFPFHYVLVTSVTARSYRWLLLAEFAFRGQYALYDIANIDPALRCALPACLRTVGRTMGADAGKLVEWGEWS